jgi:uncharacterized protein YecT (DUF1311 family)
MKKILLFVAFLGFTHLAWADCSKAEDNVELSNCVDKEHKSAEINLTKSYRALLASLAGQEKQNLIKAQKLWVNFKEFDCQSIGDSYGDGSMAPIAITQCLTNKAIVREQELSSRTVR